MIPRETKLEARKVEVKVQRNTLAKPLVGSSEAFSAERAYAIGRLLGVFICNLDNRPIRDAKILKVVCKSCKHRRRARHTLNHGQRFRCRRRGSNGSPPAHADTPLA